jgi:transposase
MNKKRLHYPETTAQQRKYLFERWEETGNVSQACREARVGRNTFYYWKPRYEEEGYAGLENFASRAPKTPRRKEAEIERKVIMLRQQNPNWGKRRIADEMTKANNWVPIISPNTVRRILQEAGLWTEPEVSAQKKANQQSETQKRRGRQ